MDNKITDENFVAAITGKDLPVLMDFFAAWCEPCAMLAPILEKVAKEHEGKLTLVKVNLDDIPLTAQALGINQIPTVVLFNNGKPVSGFVGARPEEIVKEWLDQFLKEIKKTVAANVQNPQESPEKMAGDYAEYATKNGFRLNPNPESAMMVINGLLANERKHGQKYCPCRRVTGNEAEDLKNICPCAYHRGEIEKDGHCLCNLFVK